MRQLATMLRNHEAQLSNRGGADNQAPIEEHDPARTLALLHRLDRRSEPGRHGTAVTHASSFCHLPKCARLHLLANNMRNQGVTFDETPFGNMRLVWAYGRAAEKHVRDTLLTDPDIRKRALGIWTCRCKKTKVRGHYDPAAKCNTCGGKVETYGEYLFINNRLSVSGNPDLLLRDGPAYVVYEIKSLKHESSAGYTGFKDIETPEVKHVEQGTHYRELGTDEGLLMHPKPVVLYVTKGFTMKAPWYKAFTATDALQEQVNADVLLARETAKEYVTHRDAGTVPDKITICAEDPMKKRKSCPVHNECIANG